MTQTLLDFETTRRMSRTTDPQGSRTAAQHMVTTGKRQTQAQLVLQLVKYYPGRTSRELAKYAQLDRYQIARRLPELKRDGFVRNGVPRERTNEETWVVVG